MGSIGVWREDGEALWQDNKWLADEATDYQLTSADAHQFIQALAKQLQLPLKAILLAGCEDVLPIYGATLAADVDAPDNKLSKARATASPIVRERL